MYTKEFITNYIQQYNGPYFKGQDCSFIPLNDKHGLKIFYCRDRCEKSICRQNKVYQKDANLAPQVITNIIELDDCSCYVTEILNIVCEPDSVIDKSRLSDWSKRRKQIEKEYENKTRNVMRKVESILGFYMIDNYICNFGYRDNPDNLALLDFAE